MSEYTRELHDRLRELDEAASPAPWYWDEDQECLVASPEIKDGLLTQDILDDLYVESSDGVDYMANDRLLLAARNAIPSLLDEIERLQTELNEAKHNAWSEGYLNGYNDKETEGNGNTLPPYLRMIANNPFPKEGN